MKRTALLLLALTLAACAPSAATPATSTPPAAPADGSTLRLTSGATYQTVQLVNGTRPATASTLRLIGSPLRVKDGRCHADGADLVCTLGPIAPGGTKIVYATGVTRAHVELAREDGSVTVLDAK